MKRAKRLLPKIIALENLELAFYKARKSAGWTTITKAYSKNMTTNLLRLQAQIAKAASMPDDLLPDNLTRDTIEQVAPLTIGGYHYFKIYDPKERQICAAPFEQRVLHHALMNVCHEYFERKQIYHSYASRKGKGTHAAVQQAAKYAKKYTCFLKLDVKKFFDSIHHDVLKVQLNAMFKEQGLCAIFYDIIDSYEASSLRGVPIGNLTSQYFANHILAQADHYALEQLKIPAYIRYMDDILLFHQDKAVLLSLFRRYENYLNIKLRFTLKPICLNYCIQGIPFLGFLIFPNKILLAKRSRKRYIKKSNQKLVALNKGTLSEKAYSRQMLALSAFTALADSRNFRKFVLLRQSP